MNLPRIIADWLTAENNFDKGSYSDNFTENAIVYDEGKTHKGHQEIIEWKQASNEKYKPTLEPISVIKTDKKTTLTAKVSGTFPGSPIVLKFHFELNKEKIESLQISLD
ncbi:MAG: nuclear transport factor 2 family protein [Flavobacterium sp.]|nr:nuclear transport factor 2 family protein [Flavobacterium sp.]